MRTISFRPVHYSKILIIIFTLQFGLLVPLFGAVPWADGQSRGEDLRIQLVTFGPGDDIPSYWGHSALIVDDTRLQQSRIYNYGLFSFDNGMLLHFLMGRLYFSGGAFSVNSYLRFYRSQNREIHIATLNLSASQKTQLGALLAESVLPENKTYLYHHYWDNCSTRIRDYLDRVIDGRLKRATLTKASLSLRAHTRRYVARDPLLELGLMFLMNKDIDQPIREWDEMFLPDELEKYVTRLVVEDSLGGQHPLVTKDSLYFHASRNATPAQVPRHWPGFLLAGFIFGGLLVPLIYYMEKNPYGYGGTLFGAYQALLGLLFGIPGSILFLMATITEHDVTYYNINLFFAHPLFLFLIVWGVAFASGKIEVFSKIRLFWLIQITISLLGLLLKILPGVSQDNGLVISFIIPIQIISAAGVLWLHHRNSIYSYLPKSRDHSPG